VRGMATTANHLEALAGDLERSVGRFRLVG